MINKSLLTFESSTHTYKYDGRVIPSVTTILKTITEKMYEDIPQKRMDVAADRGQDIHFAIELYNEYGVTEIDEEYRGYLDAYIQFKKDFNHKALYNEYRLYSELSYAGTCDNVGTINIDDTTLIDYKTNAIVNSNLVGLQLSGYRQALKEEGIIANQAGCLHLKKDGKYKFYIYTKEQLDQHFEIFKRLLELKNIIKFYGG